MIDRKELDIIRVDSKEDWRTILDAGERYWQREEPDQIHRNHNLALNEGLLDIKNFPAEPLPNLETYQFMTQCGYIYFKEIFTGEIVAKLISGREVICEAQYDYDELAINNKIFYNEHFPEVGHSIEEMAEPLLNNLTAFLVYYYSLSMYLEENPNQEIIKILSPEDRYSKSELDLEALDLIQIDSPQDWEQILSQTYEEYAKPHFKENGYLNEIKNLDITNVDEYEQLVKVFMKIPGLDHKPSLYKGIIDYSNYCFAAGYQYLYFEEQESKLIFYAFEEPNEMVIKTEFNKATGELIKVTGRGEEFNLKPINQISKEAISILYRRLLEYKMINYFMQNRDKIETEKPSQSVSTSESSAANTDNSNTTTIEITNKKIHRLFSSEERKNNYTKRTKKWTRRGHYREYTDDQGNVTKRVWIAPTVCERDEVDVEERKEKEQKTYNLNLEE